MCLSDVLYLFFFSFIWIFFVTFQFGKNLKKRIKTSSRHIIWDWCWSTKLLNLMNCLSNKCSWCVKFIQPMSLPYLLLMVLISHHVRLLSPSRTHLLFLIHDGLASQQEHCLFIYLVCLCFYLWSWATMASWHLRFICPVWGDIHMLSW